MEEVCGIHHKKKYLQASTSSHFEAHLVINYFTSLGSKLLSTLSDSREWNKSVEYRARERNTLNSVHRMKTQALLSNLYGVQ
jgi:hypothetical protein